MEILLGTGVTVTTFILIFIGWPAQIYKNYSTKTFGMSIILVAASSVVFMFRIPYTLIRKDWFILAPDLLAFAVHIFLFVQFFMYTDNALTKKFKNIKIKLPKPKLSSFIKTSH